MDQYHPTESDFVLTLGAWGPEMKGADLRIPIGFFLRLAEAGRGGALGWSSRRPVVDLVSDMTARRAEGSPIVAVVRAQQIKIHHKKDEVGIARGKYRPFTDPAVRLRTRVVEIKTRSLTVRTDIFDGKKKLASIWTVIVIMDPVRGAAVPMSPSLVEHTRQILQDDGYKAANIPIFNNQDSESQQQLDRSGMYRSVFKMTATYLVGISQIDFLGHVNQSRYCDWYDDMYYWVVSKAPEEKSAQEQDPEVRERALTIAKKLWPSTGLVTRVEYGRETMPGTKITIQMRWIERVSDGAFVGFLFDAIHRDAENKVKTNNRAMHFFDKDAAGPNPTAVSTSATPKSKL